VIDEETIHQTMKELEPEQYSKMSKASNPFGDGKHLREFLNS